MKSIVSVLFCLLLTVNSFSTNDNIGTSGAQFLKVGIGARPAALGDAFIAVADDYNAIQFNPSGLSLMENSEVAFQTLKWIADTQLQSFTFIYSKLSIGKFGINWKTLDYGDMDGYDIYGSYTGTFTAQDMAITASYAREFIENLSLGINLKHISLEIADESASSFATDLGMIYKMEVSEKPLNIGFVLQNLGSSIKFVKESDSLPLNIIFGAAYNCYSSEHHNLLAAIDISKPNDNDVRANTGLEYSFKNMIFVRVGYKAGAYDIESFTGGLGFAYNFNNMKLGIDTAYSNISDEFEDATRISLYFGF